MRESERRAADVEERRREVEREDKRFNREELGELLRMFSALGITVAVGITGFFLAGLYVDRWLAGRGWETRGLPVVGGVVAGLGLSGYWAYLRIVRHLRKFGPSSADGETTAESCDEKTT